MAPDAIADILDTLPKEATILDPMCGSGVVVRLALLSGRRAYGLDIDPLAVLMSRVWTAKKDFGAVESHAEEIVNRALKLRLADVELPWIDNCRETKAFVEYWFAKPQRHALRRLAWVLYNESEVIPEHLRDCLWLALSRIIITKHVGATLAWDVSHSRPHKVKTENDFYVPTQFVRSAGRIATILGEQPLHASGEIRLGDCRNLRSFRQKKIDAVITSPPYLNAIDYMRGHKMSLVWMGYSIPQLRQIRAISLGSERGQEGKKATDRIKEIESAFPIIRALPERQANIVRKYAADVECMLQEIRKVLRPGGLLVTVVGNSNLRGQFIENSKLYSILAARQGFCIRREKQRPLISSRRYLPATSSNKSLEKRMKYEVIQVFQAV